MNNQHSYRFYDEDKALAATEHEVLTFNQILSLLCMTLIATLQRLAR